MYSNKLSWHLLDHINRYCFSWWQRRVMVEKSLGILYKTETVAIIQLRINSFFLIQGKQNRLHFMRLCVKFNINFSEEEELWICVSFSRKSIFIRPQNLNVIFKSLFLQLWVSSYVLICSSPAASAPAPLASPLTPAPAPTSTSPPASSALRALAPWPPVSAAGSLLVLPLSDRAGRGGPEVV